MNTRFLATLGMTINLGVVCTVVSPSGLVTITSGKWTTCRKMAKDAVDNVNFIGKLEKRPCVTDTLHIHGWQKIINTSDPLYH